MPSSCKARSSSKGLTARGGWSEGDGAYRGQNPPDAALITYYQKKRHIFGRMKIEVFDDQGKLVDTLPANSRRGHQPGRVVHADESAARSSRRHRCMAAPL